MPSKKTIRIATEPINATKAPANPTSKRQGVVSWSP